jgi:formylmethanofuran dehydrogenase subunit B
MDGLAIMTKPLVSPPLGIHSDVEILRDILGHVKKLKVG